MCAHALPWCTADRAAPPFRLSGWGHGAVKFRCAMCLKEALAACDVFLDGLNNECLKRVLGPQLPNLPLSSALTCPPCTCLEKGGQGGACLHLNQSNLLPLSPAVTGNSKRSLTCRIWTQHETVTALKAGRVWKKRVKLMSTVNATFVFSFSNIVCNPLAKLTSFPFSFISKRCIRFTLYFFFEF